MASIQSMISNSGSANLAIPGVHFPEPSTGSLRMTSLQSSNVHAIAQKRTMMMRTMAILERRKKFEAYINDQEQKRSRANESGSDDSDCELFGDFADTALSVAAETPSEALPSQLTWGTDESVAEFFEKLEDRAPQYTESVVLQIDILAENLNRKWFKVTLFCDDSGIGLSIFGAGAELALDVCEISEHIIRSFSAISGKRGVVLAHMEVQSIFSREDAPAKDPVGMRGDFLFTVYGE